ncbi:hypothetical protein [Zooshikella harenae]|uniref:Uncharacterized protein n=1 Tax=Zooshikella harenae TaxID=2827238 RepID=A0ABS5ZKG3_9GAMM|nr:hypothetical protein [Zooshikella harenae]MBU2713730.1 hypothetical protein [Zooshikella harenae]
MEGNVMAEGYFIRAKCKPGFRRDGRYFPAEGIMLAKTALSDDAFNRLKTEPMLIIEYGDYEALVEHAEVINTSEQAMEEMIEVIGMLEANRQDSDWTKDSEPKVESIKALLNRSVTAAQRNEAWKIYQRRVQ